MKRTWFFIALTFCLFYTSKAENSSTPEPTFSETEAAQIIDPTISKILCECSNQICYSQVELEEMYLRKEVKIEKIDVDTIKVTIQQANGNPLIAILEDTL